MSTKSQMNLDSAGLACDDGFYCGQNSGSLTAFGMTGWG